MLVVLKVRMAGSFSDGVQDEVPDLLNGVRRVLRSRRCRRADVQAERRHQNGALIRVESLVVELPRMRYPHHFCQGAHRQTGHIAEWNRPSEIANKVWRSVGLLFRRCLLGRSRRRRPTEPLEGGELIRITQQSRI